jgi:hypothetical protein
MLNNIVDPRFEVLTAVRMALAVVMHVVAKVSEERSLLPPSIRVVVQPKGVTTQRTRST